MTDLILQVGASKLAISVVLAGLAAALTYRLHRPAMSHGLWLLLLAALLVPPLVAIPVFAAGVDLASVEPASVLVTGVPSEVPPRATPALPFRGWLTVHWKMGLVFFWLLGAAGVMGWSLIRALRFHRDLRESSWVAPLRVQRMAHNVAVSLDLASTPVIHATRSHIPPLLWWAGGQPRVHIPETLLSELDGEEIRCILAHELAHVRRRDHLVRWLEWLACSVFWWNPVAWWARRKLRSAEEFCCDGLVMSSVPVEPRVYASSLLRAIERMSRTPALRPPRFASTVDGRQRTTLLEERLRMIVADRSTVVPGWLRGISRVAAVSVLVASVVYCTDQADQMGVDPALVPTAGDANSAAPWPQRGSGEEPGLAVVGPELDSPWSRQIAGRVLVHLDSLVAEGSAGHNLGALEAAIQGRRLPAGTPHYFLMLSRSGGGESCCDPYVLQFKNQTILLESVVVDLDRLRETFAGVGAPLSQKDLEAVIRRSRFLKEAGWSFDSMAGFSGQD